jgi:excisionase family DNA binding protein
MAEHERLLLPISEAHWQVGLGRSKFYQYVASGEIETIKVGRRTLVPQDALREFVARLRAGHQHDGSAARGPGQTGAQLGCSSGGFHDEGRPAGRPS